MFLKTPGFTVTAIAAVAIGVGATSAIFSIVNNVILRPLPVFEPDRLVAVGIVGPSVDVNGAGNFGWGASPARFVHLQTQTGVLQDVSAFSSRFVNYTADGVAEQWYSMQLSEAIFRCLGVRVLRGRTFAPDDDLPNGPHVAVLGDALWKRRFGGDRGIVGKTISLSGEPYTVIGVVDDNPMMQEIGPDHLPGVYLPLQIDPNTSDVAVSFSVIARLRSGVTLSQANARVQASTRAYHARFPKDFGPQDSFRVMDFRRALIGDSGTRYGLIVFAGAVSLVLLIACANVANLLLARVTGRQQEMAIRAALGAGRGRMVRQLLTESLLLSFAGGAAGLWLGYAGIRALLAVNTADLPLVGQNGKSVSLDWRMLGFGLALSFATGIAFGLLPAFQGSRIGLSVGMKSSAGQKNRARGLLVVAEVTLAVVLLAGAGLLTRTFLALGGVDRGYDTGNVVTMRTSLTGPKYEKTVAASATIRTTLDRIGALPGVVAASAGCCLPLQTGTYDINFDILGRSKPDDRDVGWASVSADFFEVFRIPLRRGRVFTGRDDTKAPAVVIINEAMAKHYWPNSDPLGDRILVGKGLDKYFQGEPARQIVGIVGDVRFEELGSAPRPIMYVPQAQLPDAANAQFARMMPLSWMFRTRGKPGALVSPIREQIRQTTGLPVSEVLVMDEIVSLSMQRQRFNMLLMLVFGGSALLLAAIGVYGLMAYAVEQRRREIGIRMALGAEAHRVRGMVVREGMTFAAAGVAAGVIAAWALSRLLESLLFGVRTHDPLVFAAVPILLGMVSWIAVWLPARRASRVDPVEALRYQ